MEEGISVKANLIIAMQTSNECSFENIIKNTDVSLFNLKDSHGSNIFHDIASSSIKEEMLIKFLNIIVDEFIDRYFEDADDILRNMLNARKDQDGHTPLIEATLHNKKRIVKNFVLLGADPQIKSLGMQGVVHFAAEIGSDCLVIYFGKEVGICIDDKDCSGRTPLALACSKGHFSTASFLVAWNANVNSIDLSGDSVLHSAVFSQSYKIVKLLLIKGSNISYRNKAGKTAFELAKSNSLNDITTILQPPSCIQKLTPFKTNIKNAKGSPIKFIIFCCIFILRSICEVYYILTPLFLHNEIIRFLSISLIILSLLTFLLASCKGPGFIAPEAIPLANLVQTYRPEYICAFCESKKPTNTRHCFVCRRCIEKMDHHCPWLNNCIGKKNYSVFILFLLFNSIDNLFQILICIFELASTLNEPLTEPLHIILLLSFILSMTVFLLVFPLFCVHLSNKIKVKKTKQLSIPSALSSFEASSMLITRSMSADDTSPSPIYQSAVKMKSGRSCLKKKRKNNLEGLTLTDRSK